MMNSKVKPIEFKLNEYLNKGMELLKKDFGNFLVAYILCAVMSIIPFCGLLAMGNFYKYCRKVNKGEQASVGEIFNFDDFMPYFILQLIIIAGVIVLYIPMFIFIPLAALTGEDGGSPAFAIFMIPYIFVIVIAVFIVALVGFYIPGLISLKKVYDIKTAWSMSRIMTKNNLLSIFLFAIVVGFLSQLGILLCGIGLLITMPYFYTTHYFAFEDAIQQIEYDEIKEIGSKNEF
ncbi:hypothetical protein CEY12_13575 [Chryseobacterium sp. T16E-39]|uniref:DUF4013 domain-containing protein n=1 Tax=Chryseobacterium sp. T16E-39 TaxID=2015076 RepID=UPI000B5B38C1|nr:DUF4013 domain-containing protein [Chryseobacterium sp. T16E-39]ASK31073.1 hypothetical protein CEY12_13575 [Chryseobacterium sp. T16E-39]